ncbi:ATP-grasp domain-containing protein [Peribacillus sp. B-H-3]|jgi:hypothetical protein|uniref:ATP-grasp domain-containing protein n=1 Tax=Peribacillus sp. B-H-3 TaxID=3400420 RepID=UPI003B01CBDB
MKKRIWFNRWFSAAYHFIEAIKYNDDGVAYQIYGTHPNEDTVYFQVCDHSETEPELEEEEYVDFCLDYCLKHNIDIFIPYHHALAISGSISRFHAAGISVLVSDNYSLMDMISHKGKLYENFSRNALTRLVPEYRVVNTAKEFAEAYQMLKAKGKTVCLKPDSGRGGEGFRIIRGSKDSIEDLFGHLSHEMAYEDVYDILLTVPRFDSLIVMEYLEGYEYSIDCLAFNGKLLAAVPRKKAGGRIRSLENVPELMQIALEINQELNIPYVFNIQVKYSKGVPKLLEINPRMSGGLHISSLSGINFPYLAVKLLTTGGADVPVPNLRVTATHIEKSVVLS